MALDKDTAGQLAAVHVALPNLDPKDVSNPKAPIQHLNRRDRDGFMPPHPLSVTVAGYSVWNRLRPTCRCRRVSTDGEPGASCTKTLPKAKGLFPVGGTGGQGMPAPTGSSTDFLSERLHVGVGCQQLALGLGAAPQATPLRWSSSTTTTPLLL